MSKQLLCNLPAGCIPPAGACRPFDQVGQGRAEVRQEQDGSGVREVLLIEKPDEIAIGNAPGEIAGDDADGTPVGAGFAIKDQQRRLVAT